jgi:hypothetical protein
MDEYLVALFSAPAFSRHMRQEWSDGTVMQWHAAQRQRPTLPPAHLQALKYEASDRGRMFRCGGMATIQGHD